MTSYPLGVSFVRARHGLHVCGGRLPSTHPISSIHHGGWNE